MLALLLTAAIVVDDRVSLRAAPSETAPRQELLHRGDWLEIRGARAGFLQVYDHRRERPGYIRPQFVRSYELDEAHAPSLWAITDFLQETPGQESLGIAYAAMYLKASPSPQAAGPAVFDAIGNMADRLAARASAKEAGPGDGVLAAHLEVAESYGVHFERFDDRGRTRVCYDGEALVRSLSNAAAPPLFHARAALALTRPTCARPDRSPAQLLEWNEWRRGVLGHADPNQVPAPIANRLHLRRAEVESRIAFLLARRAEAQRAAEAATESERQLALVDKAELDADDLGLYDETSLRVNASRFAGEASRPDRPGRAIAVTTSPGKPGETCVRLVEKSGNASRIAIERCTWGVVYPSAVRLGPRDEIATIAVQPLDGWRELWVFRKVGGAWSCEPLTPASVDPDLGTIDLSGFAPDGSRVLVTRAVRDGGGVKRSYQVLRADTLTVEREAHSSPGILLAFRRWARAD